MLSLGLHANTTRFLLFKSVFSLFSTCNSTVIVCWALNAAQVWVTYTLLVLCQNVSSAVLIFIFLHLLLIIMQVQSSRVSGFETSLEWPLPPFVLPSSMKRTHCVSCDKRRRRTPPSFSLYSICFHYTHMYLFSQELRSLTTHTGNTC